MAKDILVNTESGDFSFSKTAIQTIYWNVVWGKLFDADEALYMNIVVPSGSINNTHYKDGKFECKVQAAYCPTNSEFLVRLVVMNVATNNYSLIQEYVTDAPKEAGVEYYPTFTESPQNIKACQLPLVDADGQFNIIFQQYANSSFTKATIYSTKSADLTVDNSDSQSAQLLARCAPGKYYRYPSTGLDLTKYINSVVEHTDMVDALVTQFKADSKQVTEAEFDNTTGDLQVVFSGTQEASDTNLIDPKLLDVDIFRTAYDDFVRDTYKKAHSGDATSVDFIEGLMGGSFLGIYDVNSKAKLADFGTYALKGGELNLDGGTNPYIATMDLQAGKLYVINYDSSLGDIKLLPVGSGTFAPTCTYPSLFSIYTEDGTTLLYEDEPWLTHQIVEHYAFLDSLKNRRCFIPLQNLVINFYAGTSKTWLQDTGFGVRPIVDELDNYGSILGLAADDVSGQLKAIISTSSPIESVKVNVQTNQILVIQ